MYVEQEDIFYYITVMNEPWAQPAMPDGVREGILKGMYRFRSFGEKGLQTARRSCSAPVRSCWKC